MRLRSTRTLSGVFLFAGCGCALTLLLHFGLARHRPDHGGPLAVEFEGIAVGAVPADRASHKRAFCILNRSPRPVRVVGFTTACAERGCAMVEFGDAVEIGPGSAAEFVADVKVGSVGPFTVPLVAYVDADRLHEISFVLAGDGQGAS